MNPHERIAHYALNVARLPVPPLRLKAEILAHTPFFILEIRTDGNNGGSANSAASASAHNSMHLAGFVKPKAKFLCE